MSLEIHRFVVSVVFISVNHSLIAITIMICQKIHAYVKWKLLGKSLQMMKSNIALIKF